LWLTLAPLQAQSTGHGDGVDEDRLVTLQDGGIPELGTDRIEMRLTVGLISPESGIGPANEDRKIAAFLPGPWTNGVAGPAFDRQVPGFEIEEKGGFRRQAP